MKYLFIVNPIAGVGGKRHFPELISQFCIEKQIVHKVLFTRCPGDAIEIVQQYFDHYDAFVAVGGDGHAYAAAADKNAQRVFIRKHGSANFFRINRVIATVFAVRAHILHGVPCCSQAGG